MLLIVHILAIVSISFKTFTLLLLDKAFMQNLTEKINLLLNKKIYFFFKKFAISIRLLN